VSGLVLPMNYKANLGFADWVKTETWALARLCWALLSAFRHSENTTRKVWNTAPRSKLKNWNAIGPLACLSILSFELMATCDHLEEQMFLKKRTNMIQGAKFQKITSLTVYFFSITTWNSTFLHYTWKKSETKKIQSIHVFHYLLPIGFHHRRRSRWTELH